MDDVVGEIHDLPIFKDISITLGGECIRPCWCAAGRANLGGARDRDSGAGSKPNAVPLPKTLPRLNHVQFQNNKLTSERHRVKTCTVPKYKTGAVRRDDKRFQRDELIESVFANRFADSGAVCRADVVRGEWAMSRC